MSDDVPYRTGPGSYFIPWADLNAANVYREWSGSYVGGGSADDALRRIKAEADAMRRLVPPSIEPPTA